MDRIDRRALRRGGPAWLARTLARSGAGLALAVGLGLGMPGCTRAPEALPVCAPAEEAAGLAFCGILNPEDLGLLPGGEWLVVSRMAHLDSASQSQSEPELGRPGDLLALRLADGARRRLFPPDPSDPASGSRASAGSAGPQGGTDWGDPDCPGPPDPSSFLPHGLDVASGGALGDRLVVVNHGGREALELFALRADPAPAVEWRGCVPMPEGLMANDVAWLPDGEGLVVTNFSPVLEGSSLTALWTGFEILTGRETGSVLRWTPEQGIARVEGSRGSAPNGIAVSPDGSEIFVAEWGARSIYRLRLGAEGPPVRDSVALEESPDNLTWTSDGRLLVAAQDGGVLQALACNEIEEGGCDIGYAIYSIDPASLQADRLLEGRGAASVALEIGDRILVGFFMGDHIERRPHPARPD